MPNVLNLIENIVSAIPMGKCGQFWLNINPCLDESAVREYGEKGVDVRFRGEVQPGPHVPTYRNRNVLLIILHQHSLYI